VAGILKWFIGVYDSFERQRVSCLLSGYIFGVFVVRSLVR
jgi:hypothetical protein